MNSTSAVDVRIQDVSPALNSSAKPTEGIKKVAKRVKVLVLIFEIDKYWITSKRIV
jgi:hypothetical protein